MTEPSWDTPYLYGEVVEEEGTLLEHTMFTVYLGS
jgi:hypothetical protein